MDRPYDVPCHFVELFLKQIYKVLLLNRTLIVEKKCIIKHGYGKQTERGVSKRTHGKINYELMWCTRSGCRLYRDVCTVLFVCYFFLAKLFTTEMNGPEFHTHTHTCAYVYIVYSSHANTCTTRVCMRYIVRFFSHIS